MSSPFPGSKKTSSPGQAGLPVAARATPGASRTSASRSGMTPIERTNASFSIMVPSPRPRAPSAPCAGPWRCAHGKPKMRSESFLSAPVREREGELRRCAAVRPTRREATLMPAVASSPAPQSWIIPLRRAPKRRPAVNVKPERVVGARRRQPRRAPHITPDFSASVPVCPCTSPEANPPINPRTAPVPTAIAVAPPPTYAPIPMAATVPTAPTIVPIVRTEDPTPPEADCPAIPERPDSTALPVFAHLRTYLSSDADVRNVVLYYQRALANFVHGQMESHFWQKATAYEARVHHGLKSPARVNYALPWMVSLGEGGGGDLDAQDRRPDRERLHLRREVRIFAA